MAQTQQGAFPETYHHIESPTCFDDEWTGKGKKRRLITDEYDASNYGLNADLLEVMWDKEFTAKRKLDGENMRVKWDGEQAVWNGKSDHFATTTHFVDYMNDIFAEEIFEDTFGRDKQVLLFGEHMGPKSQGNELNLNAEEFVLFDVQVNGTFLGEYGIREVAKKFAIASVYDYMGDRMFDEQTYSMRLPLCRWIEEIAKGTYSEWEGIVVEPVGQLRDRQGKRIIFKIKNKDYLR